MSNQATVHALMVAPEVRAGTHAIEFRGAAGVVGYLRSRATGWDVMYPRYGAEFLPDESAWRDAFGRWRVTDHDLDAAGRLVPISQVESEQDENRTAEMTTIEGFSEERWCDKCATPGMTRDYMRDGVLVSRFLCDPCWVDLLAFMQIPPSDDDGDW